MAGEVVLDLAGLGALLDVLHRRGYTVLGPVVRDGVIATAEVRTLADLPQGIGDEQDAGHYRLRDRGDESIFGFAAPMQSAKQVFFPADELIWRGRRGFEADPEPETPSPVALFGVRSCDLAAVGVHDAVLAGRQFVDTRYAERREGTFVVAASCADPAGTCFCVSMDTGPKPTGGFDIALTEILTDGHRFLAEAGTPAGSDVLAEVEVRPASSDDLAAADAVVEQARSRMGRTLETEGLRDVLYAGAQSPHWEDVASRCLACTNCTMVCPTCFCTSVEDVSDLTGDIDERHRVWDSCFSQEYSRLHTNFVRSTTAARYRQWATHKLAAWHDQFGSSGCVGCGRCIAWCPAGIDITAEVAAIRDAQG
jgi:formate hydrogenlyase subunit 6/NADH:ubiquinone oxidoreductase subunit I